MRPVCRLRGGLRAATEEEENEQDRNRNADEPQEHPANFAAVEAVRDSGFHALNSQRRQRVRLQKGMDSMRLKPLTRHGRTKPEPPSSVRP